MQANNLRVKILPELERQAKRRLGSSLCMDNYAKMMLMTARVERWVSATWRSLSFTRECEWKRLDTLN